MDILATPLPQDPADVSWDHVAPRPITRDDTFYSGAVERSSAPGGTDPSVGPEDSLAPGPLPHLPFLGSRTGRLLIGIALISVAALVLLALGLGIVALVLGR